MVNDLDKRRSFTIVGFETLEAGIKLTHDRFARKFIGVGAIVHPATHFGGDDNLIAVGKIL